MATGQLYLFRAHAAFRLPLNFKQQLFVYKGC